MLADRPFVAPTAAVVFAFFSFVSHHLYLSISLAHPNTPREILPGLCLLLALFVSRVSFVFLPPDSMQFSRR